MTVGVIIPVKRLRDSKKRLSSVLSKVDKASMFNSMEYRSPFLSKSIINFALDLKGNYLYY